jgi:diguanylate cyclase (GGDEF)-like protein
MFSRKRLKNFQPPIRQLLLLGLVILQSIAIIALLLAARANTSTLQLENAGIIMQHVFESVLERTQRFLAPAEQSARVLQGLINRGSLVPKGPAFEDYLLEQLRAVPQLTGLYFGGNDGGFIFARRESYGFSFKEIEVTQGRRVIKLRKLDAKTTVFSQSIIQDDGYDPRVRPWFKKALSRNALIWTGPYVFFTSQQPGITAALPVTKANGQKIGVVGVDIEISVLSDFMSRIPTSQNGAAFIVTKSGEVVGLPDLTKKLQPNSRTLPKLLEIGSLQAIALQKLGAKTQSLQNYQVGKDQWVGLMRPLLINQDATWLLGIHAPKNDFVGSSEAVFNRQLWQIVAVSFLVIICAVPLIWRISSPIDMWYQRATTDELTQLLNRTEFIDRAKKILAQTSTSSVVVMFDLDKFKTVNDVFGHDAGDKVLKTITSRLCERVRTYDLVSRFGGDEFALLLPNISLETAEERLEQWRLEIVEPFKQMVSVSVGMVEINAPEQLEQKLIEADQALLMAKNTGKNRIIQNPQSIILG